MKPSSPLETGKAYLAFSAFNHKAKKNRLAEFDLNRWLNVVKAIENKSPAAKRQAAKKPLKIWTPSQRAKYNQTMIQRKNGHV